MDKNKIKNLWSAIKEELSNTPLYFMRRIVFALLFVLFVTRVIGIIVFLIILLIHAVISFIAMRLYRTNNRISVASKHWGIGSLIALVFIVGYWIMMVNDGYPISHIRWW